MFCIMGDCTLNYSYICWRCVVLFISYVSNVRISSTWWPKIFHKMKIWTFHEPFHCLTLRSTYTTTYTFMLCTGHSVQMMARCFLFRFIYHSNSKYSLISPFRTSFYASYIHFRNTVECRAGWWCPQMLFISINQNQNIIVPPDQNGFWIR